jgi:nitrilase
MSEELDELKVAVVQMAPVFLNKKQTWVKLKEFIIEAAEDGNDLITWGETLIPGYPQHLSAANGAKFNDPDIKKVYAKYWKESLDLQKDEIIKEMCNLANEYGIYLIGGVSERHSSSHYATMLTVSDEGKIINRHRKIKPTYEERLIWADGDGEGLKTFEIRPNIKFGGLNCWENWIPYTRATLHSQGQMGHVSIWPGSDILTKDISRFMALEGRYFVVAASGLLRAEDFDHLNHDEFPMKSILESRTWQNGGSRIINPKGEQITQELVDKEGILSVVLNFNEVIEERHNFDYSGNYSREDIFRLSINKSNNK